MTLITFQDGAVVFRDGQVGTEQACCCDQECVCPNACVAGLEISLGVSPVCIDGIYSDFLNCVGGGISATMYCDNGLWLVFVSVCCFENGGACFYSYEATLECESDNLPPAGNVVLVETSAFDAGGCPPLPPTVTINK